MTVGASELEKSGTAIREMFATVAPRYDLLNHLLSACLDFVWRRRAAKALAADSGSLILDLCCGTGDQAIVLQGGGTRVVAADFCLPMLALARRKYRRLADGRPFGVAGDALLLPLASSRFDGAVVSFGLRNVADLDAALAELARILRPGGRLVVLEFALPHSPTLRSLYLFYFRRLLPWIGGLISPRGSAYRYLPASVLDFPQREGFLARMRRIGLVDVTWQDLSAGIVCLYSGRRAA